MSLKWNPCWFKTWMKFVWLILIKLETSCIQGFLQTFLCYVLAKDWCKHAVATESAFMHALQMRGAMWFCIHVSHCWYTRYVYFIIIAYTVCQYSCAFVVIIKQYISQYIMHRYMSVAVYGWRSTFCWRYYTTNRGYPAKKGPTRHAYEWRVGPFWQDTIDISLRLICYYTPILLMKFIIFFLLRFHSNAFFCFLST